MAGWAQRLREGLPQLLEPLEALAPGWVGDTPFACDAATIAALKVAGCAGLIRYAHVGNSSFSSLTAAEAAALEAAGIAVGVTYESSGTSGLGGASSGQSEAALAVDGARSSNRPAGSVVWLSAFDFDVALSQVLACQAYITAASGVIRAAGYRAGFYLPWGLAAATTGWDAAWQSESTSFWGNSTPAPGAALVQVVGMAGTYNGVSCDGNVLQDPSIFDPPAPTPAPDPTLEENMDYIVEVQGLGVTLLSNGVVTWFQAGDDTSSWTAAGLKTVVVSPAFIAQFPTNPAPKASA